MTSLSMDGKEHAISRAQALDQIASHIEAAGQHLYTVASGPSPRYSYTIGLSETTGFELILAGGIRYMADDVAAILNLYCARLREQPGGGAQYMDHPVIGGFSLGAVDGSWSSRMAPGVRDYYPDRSDIIFLQILPDAEGWTRDIPDMSLPWNSATAGAWRWLADEEPWPYPIPRDSTAVTDLATLRGAGLCEIMRWEEDGWECFSGPPEFPEEDIRVVPLAVLGTGPGLEALSALEIGRGLFRDSAGDAWTPWG